MADSPLNPKVPDASVVEFRVNGKWVPATSVIRDTAWVTLWHPNTTPDFVAAHGAGDGSASSVGIDADSGLADDNLAEAVRGRGAAVLAARKLSSAMSAANAIAAHLSDWLGPGVCVCVLCLFCFGLGAVGSSTKMLGRVFMRGRADVYLLETD